MLFELNRCWLEGVALVVGVSYCFYKKKKKSGRPGGPTQALV